MELNIDPSISDTILKLLAAWILLVAVALWSQKERLGLSRRILLASLRGLLQLLALALVLHWVFDIEATIVQAALIALFCLIAGHNSASHANDSSHRSWLAATSGLIAGCVATLPWLVVSGAISHETRVLIPLGSMVVANGMHAISIMFERLQSGGSAGTGMQMAMIPTIDTLRMVGLVHMPGIFVGMVLAGASAVDAAVAQLIVLYLVIASSLTACLVCSFARNHLLQHGVRS